MNQSYDAKKVLNIVLLVVIIFSIGLIVYSVIKSINISNNTGTLVVNSPDKNANISISQQNHSSTYIGTGSARIHITPGNYLIVASDKGAHVYSTAGVTLKSTTNVQLPVSQAPSLPSVAGVNFSGTGALLNAGLTATQISNLEKDFFAFNTSMKQVVINQSSVEPGPHDPNSAVVNFVISFSVVIDNQSYNATISYSDLVNVRLILTDPSTKSVVYDSANIQGL